MDHQWGLVLRLLRQLLPLHVCRALRVLRYSHLILLQHQKPHGHFRRLIIFRQLYCMCLAN